MLLSGYSPVTLNALYNALLTPEVVFSLKVFVLECAAPEAHFQMNVKPSRVALRALW